jgi:hypothetical protein
MPTLIEIVEQITDDLVNEAVTVDQVKRAIRQTIQAHEREEFWFTQLRRSFNTVANQAYYGSATVFSDVADINTVRSMHNGETIITAVPFDQIDINAGTGSPCHFSRLGKELRLIPTPDAAYQITVNFWGKFPKLEENEATNVWLEEAEELIVHGAKKRLALNVIYDNAIAERSAVQEREAYDILKAESRIRRPEAKLRAPDMIVTSGFNILTGQ